MIVEKQVRILNTLGFHVRPATDFAEKAKQFQSAISIVGEKGAIVNAKSCIDLLTMAAVTGMELTLRAEGPDAQEAVEVLARMFQEFQDRYGER